MSEKKTTHINSSVAITFNNVDDIIENNIHIEKKRNKNRSTIAITTKFM